MSRFALVSSLFALLCLAGVTPSTARADGLGSPSVPSQLSTGHAQPSDQGPSYPSLRRPLLIGGAVLFVGTYVPSAAFAASGYWTQDSRLYVPVAGPWMDLASNDRPLSKALLINSGVLQGLGVLSMLASLVIPERSLTPSVSFGRNQLQVSPAQLSRDGFGLGAYGQF